MGFEKAGFASVWTNENNTLFAKMHSYGITSWRKARGNGIKAEIFNTKSIEDIIPQKILKEAFPEGIPERFGVIGGPPCQDFSSAGKNSGFKGKRGHLTKVFFNYIIEIKPSFFVFENVRNLWLNKNHRECLKEILEDVKQNYFIDQNILNAIDFGVPQDRHRLFIIGIKKNEIEKQSFLEQEFNFPWPIDKKYKGAIKKYKWPSTDKFQNGTIKPDKIPQELYTNSILLSEYQEQLIPNGDEYFLPYSKKIWEIEEGNTRNRSFKRLHRYRYSPTACYGNNEVHLHAFLPRRISVREALRIQTVDDWYVLPKDIGLTHKFRMIGNGVPVKLAYAVAKSIKDLLKKGYII